MTSVEEGADAVAYLPNIDLADGVSSLDERTQRELEFRALVCGELAKVIGDNAVVVDYSAIGWRKQGVYGMTWEGKTVTATVQVAQESGEITEAERVVDLRYDDERAMNPEVLRHINELAKRSRPVRLPTWHRDK